MRTWDGHGANSLAYMAAFSAYSCMWGMQHVAACHEWHTNVAADSTRLDSTRLCPKLCATVYGLSTCGMGHMQLVATLPACCLLAAYFVCLNAGSVAGHSRLWQETHGRASNVATGNWQLPQMVASNKCCQHVGTHICALCALLCFCPATRIGIALAFAVWQLLMELLHLPLGLRLLLRVQQSDSCSTTPTACRNNHVQLRSINCLFP